MLYKYYNLVNIAEKCFCEYQNGGIGRNGINCKLNGKFQGDGSCEADEWCIGPNHATNATTRDRLCAKGNA